MNVVFVQGGGPGAHDADTPMVDSLRASLGEGVSVGFPRMPDEGDPDYERWRPAIAQAIDDAAEPTILVGHSVGGYLLLKYLTELPPTRPIVAICVIAAPFPSGDANWVFDGFELPDDFGDRLPSGAEVFLYASRDDESVPFAHRDLYAAAIPGAVTRTTSGGHQLGGDLSIVAHDIRDAAAKGHP